VVKFFTILIIFISIMSICPATFGQNIIITSKRTENSAPKEKVDENAKDMFVYNEYLNGKFEGKSQALPVQKNAIWFIGGICLGPIAVTMASNFDYKNKGLKENKLSGKSYSYVIGFIDGYDHQAKSNNIAASLIGWSTWILLYFMATR